ncbi:MAG: hypothetical protein RML37_12530, partial [Chitinophagales bacterium]|nr:hypothetical protein [Chitinophagales bacterium]
NLTTAANTYLDINGDIALRQATLTLSNGNNNNVAVSPFPSGHTYYRITGPTAPFFISGFTASAGSTDGRVLILHNSTTQPMTLLDQSTLSAASNRIMTGSGNLVLSDSGTVTLIYSAADNRWQLHSFSNGVLTNNAFGDNWRTTGNIGTIDGTNFIGTLDNVPFNIRVNNTGVGRLDTRGNIYFGQGAGNISAVPYSNIGIGRGALQNATNRTNIVAIGDSALHNNGIGATASYQGVENVAIGSKALFSNTTGSNNTASGVSALYSNTTGSNNTASGANTLYSNTNGFSNTASGYRALYSNTNGFYNTASGCSTLYSNTTGYDNSAFGHNALFNNNTGF